MAYKPMAPNERASIEAQVILKGAVELTSAMAASGNIPATTSRAPTEVGLLTAIPLRQGARPEGEIWGPG